MEKKLESPTPGKPLPRPLPRREGSDVTLWGIRSPPCGEGSGGGASGSYDFVGNVGPLLVVNYLLFILLAVGSYRSPPCGGGAREWGSSRFIPLPSLRGRGQGVGLQSVHTAPLPAGEGPGSGASGPTVPSCSSRRSPCSRVATDGAPARGGLP